MKHIPYGHQHIDGNDRRAVATVLKSDWITQGPAIRELENALCRYTGARYAVCVSNGTAALHVACLAAGISRGHEVITSPITFVASCNAVLYCGGRPVFADIDPATYNIDPAAVKAAITDRTKAIVVVHLYGQTADMDPILEAAGERGIPVIEDACQAIGARYGERVAGSMGLAGCFSFFPSKNLGGAGDGGLITTDDEKLAEDLRRLRNHGGRERYYHDEVGINSRLDAVQAAVLLVKLRHLDAWSDGRIENAARYGRLLGGIEGITVPVVEEGNRHIYNQYVIRVPRRDELKAFLQESDIGCEIYYPVPLHLQKCFAFLGGAEGDCPESEKAALETLALPIFTELTPEMQEYTAEKIAEFYGRA